MRSQDPHLLYETHADHAKDKAIRMAAEKLAWIGESFIGISLLLLCHARKLEDARDLNAREEGPLLPLPHRGMGGAMREQEIVRECPGCKRLVKIIVQFEQLLRCNDCVEVASDQQNQFSNYGNN